MEINAEFNDLVKEVTGDNRDAYDYCQLAFKASEVLDDLWDGDCPVSQADADTVISGLAFDLSRNKFFKANRSAMEAFMFMAWNAWHDSMLWKQDPDQKRGLAALFLRDLFVDLLPLVAWLTHGSAHARAVSLKCRSYYLDKRTFPSLKDYVKV